MRSGIEIVVYWIETHVISHSFIHKTLLRIFKTKPWKATWANVFFFFIYIFYRTNNYLNIIKHYYFIQINRNWFCFRPCYTRAAVWLLKLKKKIDFRFELHIVDESLRIRVIIIIFICFVITYIIYKYAF